MRRGKIIKCANCGQQRRNSGHGLCQSCYGMWYRKQVRPGFRCRSCHKSGQHYAKGLCVSCYNNAYRVAHPSEHAARERKRRAANVSHVRALDKRRNKTERRKAWKREYRIGYYERNKERLQAYNREWMRSNREKMRVQEDRRRHRQKNSECTLTELEWQEIKTAQAHRCYYCNKKSQMLHREHLIPLSRGGGLTRQNIVAACPSCNSRKSNKTPEEFAAYLNRNLHATSPSTR